ncbi:MAG: hypothetical protein H6713_30990 [Myxococcales bacterium]|nr:hypothetical protein [Myxococcales bacterium]MCB9754389.1 hypothetical protein [Myxococcales bacterium]
MKRSVALAALIDTRPDPGSEFSAWLEAQLTDHWSDYQPADQTGEPDARERVRAWSVGGVHGLETLVQARPVVRDPSASFISDFLRVPTQCRLAAYAVAEPRETVPRLDIARFQRWVGSCAEDNALALGDDERAQAEEGSRRIAALRSKLPGFLLRSLRANSAREVLFFSFLAHLHEVGGLGVTYASAEQVRTALDRLDEDLGRPATINLFVADGRNLGILHRGGHLFALLPPAVSRSRRSITGPVTDARHIPPAMLFLLARELPAAGPVTVIEEGVLSVEARAPVRIARHEA